MRKGRFLTFSSYVERDVGGAIIEVMGRRGAVTVIFSEERDINVLGVTALETLRLEVSQLREHLRRLSNYCFSSLIKMMVLSCVLRTH
ncbi:MAG: hypothetical protein ACP5NQ_07240 [Vulcanisaeta sp.]